MKKATTPAFRLTLLSFSLVCGFAHANGSTELKTVEVKGQATSATHRVSTQKIDESTSTDLKDVLFNEPSISFGGGNGQSQWMSIRGMGQDQVDIKVDNVYSDTQIFHHNSRFIFDPSLVKVVAVQKGAGSASAGIGASSGAVIAETVSAQDLLKEGQNVGFKVNAGISSNQGWSRGIAAYGRFNQFDALVAGNWVTEKDYKPGNGYQNPQGYDKVLNSALGQRGLLGKIGYSIDEDNRVELSHRQETYYGTRALREEFDFSLSDNTANNSPSYRVIEQNTTNLQFEGHNTGIFDGVKANAYRMETSRGNGSNDTEVDTYGANLNLDNIFLDRHTVKYGINYRHQKVKPDGKPAQATNEKKEDYGVYVEGIWDFEPVTLTTGLRYDHFDVTTSGGTSASDGDLNPSVGLIYDVNDQLSLNASLNYATRSPRLYEAALSGARNISTAPDLKAERSRSTEIGFRWTPNNQFRLSGNYFWQKIKDVNDFRVLSGMCGGRGATYNGCNLQSFNNGTIKNHGYELNTAYTWNGLTARAGVAYSKPKHEGEYDLSDMNTKAMIVGRTWTTGLSYQFDHPNLEIGWRGRFVQSASGTPSRGSSSKSNSGKRAGYGVNDLYANWKPTGKDDLNINFAVNNVGDKLYRSHNQRYGTNSLYEAGRDFRLSVNYRF